MKKHYPFMVFPVIITIIFSACSCSKPVDKTTTVSDTNMGNNTEVYPSGNESAVSDQNASSEYNSIGNKNADADFPAGSGYAERVSILEADYAANREKKLIAGISQESKTLNGQGYTAYKKGDYKKALELFRKSTEADPGNCFAHFNAACTIAILYGQGENIPEMYNAVITHLENAVIQDPHFATGILEDADLNPLRGPGFTYSKWIPCPGDCCPDRTEEFMPDGTYWYQEKMTDLMGGPITDEEIAAASDANTDESASAFADENLSGQEKTRSGGIYGRYTVIADRIFVYVPGLSRYLTPYPDMSGATSSDDTSGDSSTKDFIWLVPVYTDGKITGFDNLF